MAIRTRVKVKEGVERGLCGSCRHAEIREFASGRVRVDCGMIHPTQEILVPITRCSEYLGVNVSTKDELEGQAWILEVKATRVVGFLSPVEAKKKGLTKKPWED